MPLLAALAVLPLQTGWTTAYERSGKKGTGNYSEAAAYCKRLERASPYAKTIVYGRSPEGRDMVALVVSQDKAFDARALGRSRKPMIFVQNGIHSGEIEGKDASLILLREMLVDGKRRELLEGANFLFVPIYSVDAHERSSPYNRINQNGPAEMGWRSTSQNFNLNRDYTKLDAPESQAQVALIHRYRPDFFFDNHTTDGADYPYSLMLCTPNGPNLPSRTVEWQRKLYTNVKDACDLDGFLTAPYFAFDDANPARGVTVDDFGARYSNGYLSAMNRPSMLVETHMLKPYQHRVEATYSVMVRTIERCIATAPELKAMNAEADAAEKAGHPIDVLETRLSDESRPFTFIGWKRTPYKSEITGTTIPHWDHEKVSIPTTIRDRYVPSLQIAPPAAYAIPPQWTDVIARLEIHGLKTYRLRRSVTETFDGYRFANVTFPAQPFEGRFMPRFTANPVEEERTLPAGTVIVPMDQVGAKLAMTLLEPQAPDSFMRWGLFNNVFEQKEYFEIYSMEPIAAEMLRKDPRLKQEFEERLKDPKFAASASQRLNFFFERSAYADATLNRYPVVRLTKEQVGRLK